MADVESLHARIAALEQAKAEHTRLHEALQESEARFRALVQNSFDIIKVIDANGIVGYVSPSTQRITGYQPEEFIGTPIWDWLHPSDIPRTQDAFRECVQCPVATRMIEVRYQRGDGSWNWVEVVGTNLLHDPNVQGVVLNVRDITERKQTEEAQHFLTEAGVVLASSLDYETTLQSVVDLAVPQVADACLAVILSERGDLRYVAVAHTDAQKAARIRDRYAELRQPRRLEHPMSQAIQSRKAVLWTTTGETDWQSIASDARHLET